MGIKDICEPWEDVFDASLDEHLAPELDRLLSNKRSIYTDAYEFFSRTYLTESILNSLKNIVNVLKGRGGNNTFTIYSLFGGGKTHTLFAIYHAIKKPNILMHEDILKGYDEIKKKEIKQIAEDIKELGEPSIAIIYGKNYNYSGRPSSPIDAGNYKIHTVWGYLAHSLGRYDYVRKDDENLTVPDVATIREVLGEKPNVILIDEIVEYAHGLKGSQIKQEKDYVDSIPSFLDRLVTAAVGTKTIVIVTLPLEIKGKSIEKTETWYEKDFVKKYWTALHRTGAKDFPALKIGTGELVDVIKRRNFKSIDVTKGEANIRDFERVYKSHKDEVFGGYTDIIDKMKRRFPYHPDLIDILRDIIEKAELQKTRDMLKLTRKIIRYIWGREENPYMIMPWHLDVTSDEFHAELFARSNILSDYSSVVRKDIIEDAEKFDKPELARKIAMVIFLKTYIYDSPTPQTHFPSTFDISKMVYEQEFFMRNNWMPTAIIDTLQQMESKSYMHHLQTKDGRYWFWRIASVKEQIESEARKLVDEERDAVEYKLAEMVLKAVKGETPVRRKQRKIKSNIKVLSEKNTFVRRELEINLRDDPDCKTIFLVNGNATEEDCERIMFKYKDSERTYKNTIVCVYPSHEGYKKCMNHAALMLACERIKKDLPQLYPNAEEEVIKVQESIIEKLHDSAENELITQIFRTFKNVAYPSTEKDKTRPKIKVVEAMEGASSLLDQTYLTLVDPRIAKILDSLSFDSLRREVKEILGITLGEGVPKKISEIKNWFKTNPAFPMVEDKDIEDAIKEGVRELYIGISNEKIWYKRIYEDDVDLETDKGNTPDILNDDYKILPWKEAIQQQINKLLEEKKSAEENIKITYEIKYNGSLYPLEKIMGQKDWEEIVREGLIIKKIEKITPPKKDFKVRIEPDTITAKQGDEIEVKVYIEPSVNEEIYVKIKPSSGEISPSEGKLPLECTWKIIVPAEKGMKSVEIIFESEEQTKTEFLILHIESEIFSTHEIGNEHMGMVLFEATEIKDVDLLKELNNLSGNKTKVTGEVKISKDDEEMRLHIKNTNGDVAEYIISQIKDLAEGEFTADLTAYIIDGIKLDELAFHKIKPYSGKAEFKLKKGERK